MYDLYLLVVISVQPWFSMRSVNVLYTNRAYIDMDTEILTVPPERERQTRVGWGGEISYFLALCVNISKTVVQLL